MDKILNEKDLFPRGSKPSSPLICDKIILQKARQTSKQSNI